MSVILLTCLLSFSASAQVRRWTQPGVVDPYPVHFDEVNSPDSGDGNYRLGLNAYTGRIFAQDFTMAAQYFKQSADQENVNGLYALAYLYSVGEGVMKSDGQAAQYWLLGAKQGHTWAQYNLGHSLALGLGVKQDYLQAAQWYKKASDAGMT